MEIICPCFLVTPEACSELKMTLQKAKEIIVDDQATPGLWAIAAAAIYSKTREEDRLTAETLRLLLLCLQRGGGAVSSGTVALYAWTKRPFPPSIFQNSHDPEEWECYLRDQKLI
jgi:hypothetical protein